MFKFLFFLMVLLVQACAVRIPDSVRTKLSLQLPGHTNRIESSKIRFDGFYQMFDREPKYYGYNPQHRVDSTPIYFIFFKDGLFAYNLQLKKERNDTVSNFSDFYILKDGSLDASFWGIFKRIEDSLIIQILHKPASANDSWRLRRLSFQILSDSTLLLDENVDLLNDSGIPSLQDSRNSFSLAHFMKLSTLPMSKSWLKEQKWIWRDQEDWKKYMEEIGKKIK